MVKIFFIYADNCEHCQQALSTIEEAIVQCKNIACEILKFKYDTPVAINIAVNNGLNDLPSFVVGRKAFNGDDYSLNKIIEAIKIEAKNDRQSHSNSR